MHSPLWMESRIDCFLCRWKRSQGDSGDGMKISIQCKDCNEACVSHTNEIAFMNFTLCGLFLFIQGHLAGL